MSITNCPTCGAKTDSIVANCEYCGIEFERAQSLTPQEYVQAVARAVSSYTFKDEAITIIPIPSDVPTLMAFFIYCHGNVSYNPDYFNQPDQSAWRSKAKASFEILRLASSENPKISKFLLQYERTYSEEGMKETLKIGNDAEKKQRYLSLVIIFFVIFFYLFVFLMIKFG